jgi:hypothetical protein
MSNNEGGIASAGSFMLPREFSARDQPFCGTGPNRRPRAPNSLSLACDQSVFTFFCNWPRDQAETHGLKLSTQAAPPPAFQEFPSKLENIPCASARDDLTRARRRARARTRARGNIERHVHREAKFDLRSESAGPSPASEMTPHRVAGVLTKRHRAGISGCECSVLSSIGSSFPEGARRAGPPALSISARTKPDSEREPKRPSTQLAADRPSGPPFRQGRCPEIDVVLYHIDITLFAVHNICA